MPRADLKNELHKLKNMSAKDKLWYLWEYYKFHFLAVILLLGVLGSVVSTLLKPNYDTLISCAVINNKALDASMDYLENGFWEYKGSPAKERVFLDTSMQISVEENASSLEYASMAKLSAMVFSQDLDVIISTPDVIEHYGGLDGSADLEELLPPDLLEQLEPCLHYVTTENGRTYACGISLEDTEFIQKTGIAMEQPMLSILEVSTHKETGIDLIRYLFGLSPQTPADGPAS